MPRYSVHLKVKKKDSGLDSITTSRPTYAVGASDRNEAIKKAEHKLKSEIRRENKVKLENIEIKNVNCYGTR